MTSVSIFLPLTGSAFATRVYQSRIIIGYMLNNRGK
jgi:hypothetical protein